MLPSGKSLPLLALGTFDLKSEEVAETIKHAVLEVGYRHIDTATVYGNEVQVGEGLQQVFATNRVSREEVFLVTKCWMTWFRNVENEQEYRISRERFTSYITSHSVKIGNSMC